MIFLISSKTLCIRRRLIRPMAQEQAQARSRAMNKIALASLSAMVAETTTFPIDITKTSLQLHAAAHPVSAFQVATDILRKQGVTGLYKGLSPALLRHLFYTPIRTVGYEQLRHAFISHDNHSLSLPSKALIGGISGVIAQHDVCYGWLFLRFSQCFQATKFYE
ncbi:putative mitochondrial carrier domain superfamily [Helianthus annuus]|nr:putative mitochondrial carrier domain superfamily [Helianthus annuus]